MDKKQKRAAALKRQQELVNAAKAASREMTAEETAEFNTLQGQIDQLNREIELNGKSLMRNASRAGILPHLRPLRPVRPPRPRISSGKSRNAPGQPNATG